jgi:murein DD-endopeptidase MepM/ murein hydrolase activator NlpD
LQVALNPPDAANREYGNGVVIRHIDGFETQYCHLAKGSITVKSGDLVTA